MGPNCPRKAQIRKAGNPLRDSLRRQIPFFLHSRKSNTTRAILGVSRQRQEPHLKPVNLMILQQIGVPQATKRNGQMGSQTVSEKAEEPNGSYEPEIHRDILTDVPTGSTSHGQIG